PPTRRRERAERRTRHRAQGARGPDSPVPPRARPALRAATRHPEMKTPTRRAARYTRFTVHGSRFTVHGSRFTVHGSRFTVRGSRFAVRGSRFTVHGSRFTVHGSEVLWGGPLFWSSRCWRRRRLPARSRGWTSSCARKWSGRRFP